MPATLDPPFLTRLSALADATRSRLLHLLSGGEYAVIELCAITQLPQSTVSRHLRVLADEGWVTARAEGTSNRYRLAAELDSATRRMWQLVREQVRDTPAALEDVARAEAVRAERRVRSREFFQGTAGRWDVLRAELFGARPELVALPGLLDERWRVGDLGCGTGQVSAALAPFVRRVVAVDGASAMLAAARKRLAGLDNVDIRAGELEALPLEAATLDAAVLFLALPYVPDPSAVLAEAARVLVPGGRLLVVDLVPHDRADLREQLGHQWPGFSSEQVAAWCADLPLEGVRYTRLPADPAARGPGLFAATARRRDQ